MRENAYWILIGIALVALAVAIGAFGAHGIKDRVSGGIYVYLKQELNINFIMHWV